MRTTAAGATLGPGVGDRPSAGPGSPADGPLPHSPCSSGRSSRSRRPMPNWLPPRESALRLLSAQEPGPAGETKIEFEGWSGARDLNPGPHGPEPCALPDCASPRPTFAGPHSTSALPVSVGTPGATPKESGHHG